MGTRIVRMKAVVTADNHLNRYYKKMMPGLLEKKREMIRENFAKIVDYAIEEQVDFFLHCGDLFDMSNPRNQEVSFAAQQIARLDSKGIRTFLIVGNHDMSLNSEAADSSPHSVFEWFKGPNVFMDVEDSEPVEIEVEDESISISGLSYNPVNNGEDPLSDFEGGNDADWSLLLTHYGIEGTMVSEECKSTIRRESIRDCGLDLICSGHIHSHSEMSLEGTTAVIPGITERLDFSEENYSTGFYMIYFDDEVETEYVPLDSQPVESQEKNVEDLENPQRGLKDRIDRISGEDKMLRFRIKGRLSREEYRELNIHELWKQGREKNFYFDLKDDISLQIDSNIDMDGERLSQKEELERVAEKFKKDYSDDSDIIQKAKKEVVTDYREQ